MAIGASPPYSYTEYDITSSTAGPFSYADFLLLDDEQVGEELQFEVYVNGTLQVLTTDYTVDTANDQITFTYNLSSGDYLKIQRASKRDARYVDFINASTLGQADLDLDANQVFFVAQEAFDLAYDSMHLGNDGRWEGRSIEVRRIADATLNDSAPSWGQVQALVTGGSNITLNTPFVYGRLGDGVTQAFDLADDNYLVVGAAEDIDPSGLSKWQLMITINGVAVSADTQDPQGYYTLSGTTVTFTFTPAIDDHIVVVWFPGTIAAVLSDNTVGTDALQDGCVTTPKLATDAVTEAKLADDAVSTDKIVNLGVTTAKINDLAVTTAKIAAANVTAAKIATGINSTSVPTASTSSTIDDVVWDDNGGVGYQPSTTKLTQIVLNFTKTTTGSGITYVLEISDNASFTGTPIQMDTVRLHGSSLRSDATVKAWVPASYYWRLRRTNGSNNNNVTLTNIVTLGLLY